MELNALTRWESLGKDLYAKGQLGHEIQRIKQFSRILAHSRHASKQETENDQHKREQKEEEAAQQSSLTAIHEEPAADIVTDVVASPSASPVSPASRVSSPDGWGSSSVLYRIESDPEFGKTKKEEEIEEELEQENLDFIPVVHARVRQRSRVPSLRHILLASLLFFVYRFCRRFVKGFLVGYCGKLLFGLVSALLRSKGNLSLLWQYTKPLFTREDVTGYGLFLGGFLAVFESGMRWFKRYTQLDSKTAHTARTLRVVISASISGLCLFFIPPEYRVSLSMFFFVRALEIMGHSLVESGLVPPVPGSDAFLMATSSSVVIWCWLFHRSALESGYCHFLQVQGAKPRWMTDGYALCHYGNEALFNSGPVIREIHLQRQQRHLPPLQINSPTLRCDLLHPNQSHFGHMLTFLRQGVFRALPVYLPVYLLPLLMFRLKDVLRDPVRSLSSNLFSVFRSCLFLSAYCTGCWFSACMVTNYLGYGGNLNGMIAGFVGGMMVLIEKKSRRIELALYVLAQAIPAAYRCLHSWGYLPYIKHAEVSIFIASIAVILSTYILRPHLLRRSYLSLLLFFFGSGGRTAGFHTPQQRESFTQRRHSRTHRDSIVAKETRATSGPHTPERAESI